jgi:hypothetical protein
MGGEKSGMRKLGISDLSIKTVLKEVIVMNKKIYILLCFISLMLITGVAMANNREINQKLNRNDFKIIYKNIMKHENLWRETLIEKDFNVDLRLMLDLRLYEMQLWEGKILKFYTNDWGTRFITMELLPENELGNYDLSKIGKNDILKLKVKKSLQYFTIIFYYKNGTFRFIDWNYLKATRGEYTKYKKGI